MKRFATPLALVALAALAAPALLADVKTTEKTLTRFEGILGAGASMLGGSAYNDGVTSTVAVKGNRKSSIGTLSGSIIDMTEQKVYALNPKTKEYTVSTFDQIRQRIKDMMDQGQKRAAAQPKPTASPAPKSDVETQTDFDIKETGQHKPIAGYDAHEVVMTATTHEKGKTLEQSGGMVMTIHDWLGPKIPAVDEIVAFDMKYAKLVYGDLFSADSAQMAQASAMYPGMQALGQRMAAESQKLQGTTLSSVTTFESVLSNDEAKKAADQNKKNQDSGANSGFGAMLAKKMGAGGPTQQRTLIMTITKDLLTIEKTATDADVAIPAGYKEKK